MPSLFALFSLHKFSQRLKIKTAHDYKNTARHKFLRAAVTIRSCSVFKLGNDPFPANKFSRRCMIG